MIEINIHLPPMSELPVGYSFTVTINKLKHYMQDLLKKEDAYHNPPEVPDQFKDSAFDYRDSKFRLIGYGLAEDTLIYWNFDEERYHILDRKRVVAFLHRIDGGVTMAFILYNDMCIHIKQHVCEHRLIIT